MPCEKALSEFCTGHPRGAIEHPILAMASAAVGTKRSYAAMSEDSRSPTSALSPLHDANLSGGLYTRQRPKPSVEESCEQQQTAIDCTC